MRLKPPVFSYKAGSKIFPAAEDYDMNNHKIIGLAAPTESGDAVRWDDLQVGLNYIIGVEWDTSSSSPAMKHIDAYGVEISKTAEQWAAWFNAHPIHANMWRCTLSVAGVPTFGANARGDGLSLDGSAGQVVVRVPKYYMRFQKIGTKIRLHISPVAFTGFEVHSDFFQRGGTERDAIYVGAYTGVPRYNTDGSRYMLSASGWQPWTGQEIVELAFSDGSTEPAKEDVLEGATSKVRGTVVDVWKQSGEWGSGTAAGKIMLKTVDELVRFDTGSVAPTVGQLLTCGTATGELVAIILSSGSWAGGDAAGYFVVRCGNGIAFPVSTNITDPLGGLAKTVSTASQASGEVKASFTNGEDIQKTGATILKAADTGTIRSLTRQLAETYCNNIGSSRWGCENPHTLSALTILYLIEYANWNSQSTSVGIGSGVVSLPSTRRYGGKINGADSVDTNIAVNGTGAGTGTDGQTPIVWRGIENFWGNCHQFIIGLDALDAAYRILKRDGTGTPACPLTAGNYEASTAAPVAYNSSTNPDGYAKDIESEELLLPHFLANLGGGSSSTYLCDYIYWHRIGQVNILVAGGAWFYGASFGVGCRALYYVSSLSIRYCAARCEFV